MNGPLLFRAYVWTCQGQWVNRPWHLPCEESSERLTCCKQPDQHLQARLNIEGLDGHQTLDKVNVLHNHLAVPSPWHPAQGGLVSHVCTCACGVHQRVTSALCPLGGPPPWSARARTPAASAPTAADRLHPPPDSRLGCQQRIGTSPLHPVPGCTESKRSS